MMVYTKPPQRITAHFYCFFINTIYLIHIRPRGSGPTEANLPLPTSFSLHSLTSWGTSSSLLGILLRGLGVQLSPCPTLLRLLFGMITGPNFSGNFRTSSILLRNFGNTFLTPTGKSGRSLKFPLELN